jgi:hypothetical protein
MGSVLWMDGGEDLLVRDLHLVGDAEHDGRRECVRTTGGVAALASVQLRVAVNTMDGAVALARSHSRR